MSDISDTPKPPPAPALSDDGALEPLLTAYVLGEIDQVQRARIDALLKVPGPAAQALRAEIDAIRAMTEVLHGELNRELQVMRMPGLTPSQLSAISAAAQAQEQVHGVLSPPPAFWLRRFSPALSALVAASILLVVMVTQMTPPSAAPDLAKRDERVPGSGLSAPADAQPQKLATDQTGSPGQALRRSRFREDRAPGAAATPEAAGSKAAEDEVAMLAKAGPNSSPGLTHDQARADDDDRRLPRDAAIESAQPAGAQSADSAEPVAVVPRPARSPLGSPQVIPAVAPAALPAALPAIPAAPTIASPPGPQALVTTVPPAAANPGQSNPDQSTDAKTYFGQGSAENAESTAPTLAIANRPPNALGRAGKRAALLKPRNGDARSPEFPFVLDHGSVSVLRHRLQAGEWPAPGEVDIQELLQGLGSSAGGDANAQSPVTIAGRVGICPWRPEHLLALVRVHGHDLQALPRQPGTLLALVNCSASMNRPDRLGVITRALHGLAAHLGPADELCVQSFAHGSRQELPPTGNAQRARIDAAIDDLEGGEALEGHSVVDGLQHAIATVIKQKRRAATRIVLCTDAMASLDADSFQRLLMVLPLLTDQHMSLCVLCVDDAPGTDLGRLLQLARVANGRLDIAQGAEPAQRFLNDQLGAAAAVATNVDVHIMVDSQRIAQVSLIGHGPLLAVPAQKPADVQTGVTLLDGQTFTALYELTVDPGSTALQILADPSAPEVLRVQATYDDLKEFHAHDVTYALQAPAVTPAAADDALAYAAILVQLDAFLRHDGSIPTDLASLIRQVQAILPRLDGNDPRSWLPRLLERMRPSPAEPGTVPQPPH